MSKADGLKSLNISNCGMDAIATTTLAKSILTNNKMRLERFYGFRSKMRDGGIEAMADVIEKQGSI